MHHRENLLDLKRCEPLDTDHTPKAFLIGSDEAKAFEGHGGWIVGLRTAEEELVGWDPFCEGADILPEVLVVLVCVAVCCCGSSFLGAVGTWLSDLSWWRSG